MARLIFNEKEKEGYGFYTEIFLNKSDLNEHIQRHFPKRVASTGYFARHGSCESPNQLGYKMNGRLYPIEDFKIIQSFGSTGFYVDILEKV